MRGWRLIAVAGCLVSIALACVVAAGLTVFFVTTQPSIQVSGLLPGGTDSINRLVVQGSDGNIYTVNPDGSERAALTDDASRTHIYQQPTWSPSGDRIAWAEILAQGNDPQSALRTSRPDGSNQTRADTRFPPFYLNWSPDSTRLAYLSNWDSSIALQMVDVAGGGTEVDLLEQGQPFYFSWAPNSQELFAHIGAGRLAFFTVDGEQRRLDTEAAPFPAPQWSDDGSRLVYAIRENDAQYLVVTNERGGERNTVTQFDGSVTFDLSPDGSQLAYVETEQTAGVNAFGPLYVTDLETKRTRELSKVPVLAFFWSPDGKYLIFLRPAQNQEPAPTPGPEARGQQINNPQQQNEFWLRWDVWNGERTYPLSRFMPSPVFLRDYLRFFDQYARSMTPWAPDSSAFVYAGWNSDGREGIWVHSVEEESAPQFVMEGVYAAWSPR